MKKLLFTVSILFSVGVAFAQENTFTFDVQLRTRGEYNNGAGKPRAEGIAPAFFVNNRARIGAGYERGILQLKASVQHTGIWGQDAINPAGPVSLNEAWARLNWGSGWFVQLGRQQLSYDDERILGGLDWHVAGNWHDALKGGYDGKQHKAHLILAFNQAGANVKGGLYDGPMPYKAMQTLWYHFSPESVPLGVSLLAMNLGREGGSAEEGAETRYMQTLGTDLSFNPGAFDLHGAFYYQMGKNPAGAAVSAWMASGKAAWKINGSWTVNLGYDYRSGNRGTDGTVRAFDQLFGTHHKFYGFMDYFLRQVPTGLQDVQAGVTAKLSQKVSLLANYHYFATAVPQENLGSSLGHEADLQLTVNITKNVTLMAGYSVMRGTPVMDAVLGGNHKVWQDWGWISINVNPRILSLRW